MLDDYLFVDKNYDTKKHYFYIYSNAAQINLVHYQRLKVYILSSISCFKNVKLALGTFNRNCKFDLENTPARCQSVNNKSAEISKFPLHLISQIYGNAIIF